MVAQSIIESVRAYLRACQDRGIDVRFGVVFGSQVTGKTHEWSDIDLVVVSPRFDGDYPYSDRSMLWQIAGRVDSKIEPIPCGEQQWETDDERVIIEVARREGERVYPEEALAGVYGC